MTQPRGRFSLALALYVGATVLLAVALALWGMTSAQPPDSGRLGTLVVLGVLSWHLREFFVFRTASLSLLSVVLIASAAAVGPAGAALVGAVSAAADIRKGAFTARAMTRRVFNSALCAALGAAGGLAYQGLGGVVAPWGATQPESVMWQVGVPLMVADLVACVVNAVLVSGIIAIDTRAPFLATLRGLFETTGAAYLGYGVLGFLLVVLWFPVGLGAFSVVFVLVPLMVARWAMVQYNAEQNAHERTARALITALSARDPDAAERAGRTAELAERMATDLGLGPAEVNDVRHAALLQDIGRLAAVPADADLAPEVRAARERATIDELLRGIDFLEGARRTIGELRAPGDGARSIQAQTVSVASAWVRDPQPGGRSEQDGRIDPAVRVALRDVVDRGRSGWTRRDGGTA